MTCLPIGRIISVWDASYFYCGSLSPPWQVRVFAAVPSKIGSAMVESPAQQTCKRSSAVAAKGNQIRLRLRMKTIPPRPHRVPVLALAVRRSLCRNPRGNSSRQHFLRACDGNGAICCSRCMMAGNRFRLFLRRERCSDILSSRRVAAFFVFSTARCAVEP